MATFLPDPEEAQGLSPQAARFVPDEPEDPRFVPDPVDPRFTPDPPSIGLLPSALATGARVLFPLVGAAAAGGPSFGAGTLAGLAAGGAAGEFTGQAIEKAFGSPKGFQLAPILGEAALSAAAGPLSRLGTVARQASRLRAAGIGAAEGAALGAAGETVSKVTREGELPGLGDLARGAAVGGVLGGGLGAASGKPKIKPKSPKLAPGEPVLGPGINQAQEAPVSPVGKGVLEQEQAFSPGPLATKAGAPVGTPESIADAIQVDQVTRDKIRQAVPSISLISPTTLKGLVDEIKARPAEQLAAAFEETDASKAFLRVNRQLAEALERGLISAPEAEATLKAVNLGFDDIRKVASASGMSLRQFGILKKTLDASLKSAEDTAKKYRLTTTMNDILQLRRGLLTTQLSTAVRNSISQTARYGLELGVNGLRGALGDARAGKEALYGLENLLSPLQAGKQVKRIEEAVPGFFAQLTRGGARTGEQVQNRIRLPNGKVLDGNKVIERAQVFNLFLNSKSDDFFRGMSVTASLRSSLDEAGLDSRAFMASPKDFLAGLDEAGRLKLDEAIQKGILTAQQVSFGEPPEHVFRALSNWVQRVPLLSLATPFPRFMGSAFSFVQRHNPTGLLAAFQPETARDANALREVYARATAGTALLAAGLAVRGSELGGNKPTEVRLGDGQVTDLKAFYPFSFHLVLANRILEMAQGKKASEVPWEEIRENFLAVGRFSDSVPAIFELAAANGDVGGMVSSVEKIAGDFLGGFGVGAKTLKDGLEGAFARERSVDTRSTQAGRRYGPLLASVPFAGELLDLPPLVSPTTGKDVARNEPVRFLGVSVPASIFRQVSGISVKDTNLVEKELRAAGIDPWKRVGATSLGPDQVRGADLAATKERNLTRTLLAPILAAHVSAALPLLSKMDPDTKKIQLSGLLTKAERAARAQAQIMLAKENPEDFLAIQASKPWDTTKELARIKRARGLLATKFGRED